MKGGDDLPEALRVVADLLLTSGLHQGAGNPLQPPDGTRADLDRAGNPLQPLRPVARLAGVGAAQQQLQRQQQQQPLQQQSRWGTGSGGMVGAHPAAAAQQQQQQQQPRLDSQSAATRLAVSRERNRLSQQRFRERQRARQRLEGEQCAVLLLEVEELEGENARLHRQNSIYERVLAVRDAMLQAFTSLHPTATEQLEQQQQQQRQRQAQQQSGQRQALPAPPSAAAHDLARALEALPGEQEMADLAAADGATADAAVAGQQHHQQQEVKHEQQQELTEEQQQQQQQASPGLGSGASSNSLEAGQPTQPQCLLGEPHRSGAAAQLDGSALQQVELIPPPTNQALRDKIATMTGPDELVQFFQQWQEELGVAYRAAQAAVFDSASVAEVERVTDRMTDTWWHVGQLKPAFLCYLAHTALPANSSQLPLWREIAGEVLPQLDEKSRAIVRRSWFNYSKQLAKIAVGVSKWVRRLQELSVPPTGAMATNATQALQLAEITSHMAAAVQEEYTASMEFVAAQFPASDTLTKAYVNYRSTPYLPDIVAIVYQMICLDREERQARAQAGAGPDGVCSEAAVARD